MKKLILLTVFCAAASSLTVCATPIQLRPGLPLLFVDDSTIAEQTNVVRILHEGVPDDHSLLEQPATWEEDALGRGQICMYGSVYPNDAGTGYRMWYNSWGRVNYAESTNGVDWVKPILGVNAIGSDQAQNNIVIKWLACPSILDDKFETDPQKRFKLVGCRYASDSDPENPTRGYYSATSPDGIHWTEPKRFLKHWWDTCTIAQNPFTGEYLFYHKHEISHLGAYRRTVWLSRSTDFENWTEPELVFSADKLDDAMFRTGPGQSADTYLFPVVPHAGGFFAIPSIFQMTAYLTDVDKDRCMSGHDGPLYLSFATSTNGVDWARLPGRRPFLPATTPEGQYNACYPGCSSGGSFLHVGDESWLYTYASAHTHGQGYPADWKRGDPMGWSIGRAVWRRWGFVSMETYNSGSFTTVPVVLVTPEVSFNIGGVEGRDESSASVAIYVKRASTGATIASATLKAGGTRQIPDFGTELPVGEPLTFTFKLTRAAVYSMETEFSTGAKVQDGVLTITVPEMLTSDLDADLLAQINSGAITNIVKKGAGAWRLGANLPNYRGEIHLEEGTFEDCAANGLGDEPALTNVTIFVGSNATWKLTRTNGGPVVYPKVDLAEGATLAFGVAPRFCGGLTLHGDLTVTGGLSFGGGELNLNGHTLSGAIGEIFVERATNGGRIETTVDCTAPGRTYAGGAALDLVLAEGKTFTYRGPDDLDCPWRITYPSAGTFNAAEGTSLAGAVTVGDGETLTFNQTAPNFHLRGSVTADTFLRARAETTQLYLGGSNAIAALQQKGGPIVALRPEALPADRSKISFESSFSFYPSLAFAPKTAANPDGWTASELDEIWTFYANDSNRYLGLAADKGDTCTVDLDFSTWTNKFAFGGYGEGQVILRVPNGVNATTITFASWETCDFVISAQDQSAGIGTLLVSGFYGPMTVQDSGPVQFGADTSFGVQADRKTSLTLGAGARLAPNKYLRFPNKSGGRATLEILSGAVVTNQNVHFAGLDSATGACYLRGGEWVPSTLQTSWGANSLAYIEQSGGTFRASTVNLGYGSNGSGGLMGLYVLKGGELVAPKGYDFVIGMGSTGVVYQTGGRMTFGDRVFLARGFSKADSSYGAGFLTVAGGLAEVSNVTMLADRAYSTAALNLIGSGVLATPQVRRSYGTGYRSASLLDETGAMTTSTAINFNGGTLKAIPNSKTLDGQADELIAKGNFAPDRVTVFAGGAIFDTNGRNMNLSVPLTAPTGGTIAALALPNGVEKLTGYLAAPAVTIDGDGEGATAVAEFDSAKGEVTGVRVTSPGFGYTAANTTATLWYGQDSSSRTKIGLVVTVAADALTGGLTKRGAGTLTLNAVNAYAGATIIERGTLKLGVSGALPNATVVMKGGSLAVADGVTYPAGLAFDVSNLDYSDTSARHVLATDWTLAKPEAVGLPIGWSLVIDDGELAVQSTSGLLMFLR